jgi:hypothetical protein
VRRAESHLDDLRRIYGLSRADEAIEVAEYLRELLLEKPISHILAIGLHEYLDIVQIHIQKLAAAIGRGFFRDWRPADPAPAVTPSLSQSQTQVQAQLQPQGPEHVA